MIRKNALLCKVIRIKISSKSIFDSYMALFQPHLETCPICGSTGNCHIHDYYDRSIIDYIAGRKVKSSICVLRVFCESCKHAHAVLPDVIIPYSSHSLFFVLRILAEYFANRYTAEQLCEKFDISPNQLRKWIALFKSHKRQWLGLLDDASSKARSFLEELTTADSYSGFSMSFIRRFAYSFMQSHKNPVLIRPKGARYHQTIFDPDISIF
jgi:hypothetical protein